MACITVLLFTVSLVCTDQGWAPTAYAYSDAQQVAGFTNRERANKGLSLLKYSDKLSEAAKVRADEIASHFSHIRPDGSDNFTVMDEWGIGYSYFGENIAFGPTTPESVVSAWMDSPTHRSNILKGGYNCIGVGITYANGTYYWVQLFAKSRSLSGTVITVAGSNNTASTTAKTTTTFTTSTTPAATVTTTTTVISSRVTTQTTAKDETGQTTSAPNPHQDSAEESSSEQQGFWAKIAAFFKHLFGWK